MLTFPTQNQGLVTQYSGLGTPLVPAGGQPVSNTISQDQISSPSPIPPPTALLLPPPQSSNGSTNTALIVIGGAAALTTAAALIYFIAHKSAKKRKQEEKTGSSDVEKAGSSNARSSSVVVRPMSSQLSPQRSPHVTAIHGNSSANSVSPKPPLVSKTGAGIASSAPSQEPLEATLETNASTSVSPEQSSTEFEAEQQQLQEFHKLSGGQRRALLENSFAMIELGAGSDAKVFPLLEYSHLVMRIPRQQASPAFSDTVFIPVDYGRHEALKHDMNIGLPLALGVPRNSETARKKAIPYQEASEMLGRQRFAQMRRPVPIAILRACDGESPSDAHKLSYGLLRGKDEAIIEQLRQKITPKNNSPKSLRDKAFFETLQEYAIDSSMLNNIDNLYRDLCSKKPSPKDKFLADCKSGSFICRKEDGYFTGFFYHPEAQKSFYRRYERFAADYLAGVSRLVSQPQKFFDNLALSVKHLTNANIAIDYQHCENIMVNHELGTVKWIDLGAACQKEDEVTRSRADNVNRLAQVLLGVEANGVPWKLMATDAHKTEINAHIATLSNKLESGFKRHNLWKPETHIDVFKFK